MGFKTIEEYNEDVKDMEENLKKMEELIGKLLHLEKIKTDAYTMDFATCEVSEIVSSIITDFKPIFSEKEFNITGSSKMRCDKSWLFEAIFIARR